MDCPFKVLIHRPQTYGYNLKLDVYGWTKGKVRYMLGLVDQLSNDGLSI